MKRLKIFSLCSLAAALFCSSYNVSACTDFRLTAKDGSIMVTRSMEFGTDLKSNVRSSNRGRVFTTTTPNGKPGMSWKAKYGYVFADGLNVDVAIDGMNEKGLSFEALYLPTLAQYQTIPAGHEKEGLAYINLGDWILSNFDSVEQVRQALQHVYVFAQKIPEMGDMVFPLHFAIYDATGKGIVVEYVAGKLNIYDNKLGVMTNTPAYDWHLTNLINYVHLTPTNPNPIMINGQTFGATGQGFGMIGMPGDISPPSRFVKTAIMLGVVLPVDNSAGMLNLAEHIINNVDIPLGLVREPANGNYTSELTQWVVFKDLTHRTFYYRTYGDLSLRAITLDQLNFAENAPRFKMPMAALETIRDVTGQFVKSPQPVVLPAAPIVQPAPAPVPVSAAPVVIPQPAAPVPAPTM